MMAVLPILGLVAAGLAAAGSIAGGISQMNNANAQAKYEKQAAAENARRQSVDAKRQLGKMRANYGASGVTLDERQAVCETVICAFLAAPECVIRIAERELEALDPEPHKGACGRVHRQQRRLRVALLEVLVDHH